jgi:DNA-binding protein Fis
MGRGPVLGSFLKAEMDINPFSLPAIVALLVKAGIFFYAHFSQAHNLQTRVYLWFLFALAIQNIAEITAFYYSGPIDKLPIALPAGFVYFGASIMAIALLLHLAVLLVRSRPISTGPLLLAIYAPALLLEMLLWSTSLLVTGFEPMNYTYTKVPGLLYFLFEIYAIGYLCAVVTLLVYGSYAQHTRYKRLQNKLLLLGMLPIFVVVTLVVTLQHYFGLPYFNTTVTLPIAVTCFLIVTAYATHQYRLFDIDFYVPWSKVRKRKTAFYARIRAMIAEIADLPSVDVAVRRLADTLRCPVTLVGTNGIVIAEAGAAGQMTHIAEPTLHKFEHIVVAHEIADTSPDTHALLRDHNVAAVVPLRPHSRHGSGWLLLGDAFSEQVYTPLDFRLVEQLFDKMADLFLDRLLTMRAELADTRSRLRDLQRRLRETELALAPLQREVTMLREQNMRLTKERTIDSLQDAVSDAEEALGDTIVLLGRDRAMLRSLRKCFPQLACFVGPQSTGFQRLHLPDLLVWRVEHKPTAACGRLLERVRAQPAATAVLVYGPGADDLVSTHRQALRGCLIEVLARDIGEPALVRKIHAIAELRRSVRAIYDPDYPLIARSHVCMDLLSAAGRIAGFREPVAILSDDQAQAIAFAAHMHALGGAPGKFVVMDAMELGGSGAVSGDGALHDARGDTLMIDHFCALTSETRDELLAAAAAMRIRLIARCTRQDKARCGLDISLEIPSLRERKDDIAPLVHYYTLQFNLQASTRYYLKQSEIEDLLADDLPVDLTALKAAVFARLQAKPGVRNRLPELDYSITKKSLDEHVAEFEARLISQTLARCNGNKSKAARLLGLRANTLFYKMQRYGLSEKKKG